MWTLENQGPEIVGTIVYLLAGTGIYQGGGPFCNIYQLNSARPHMVDSEPPDDVSQAPRVFNFYHLLPIGLMCIFWGQATSLPILITTLPYTS